MHRRIFAHGSSTARAARGAIVALALSACVSPTLSPVPTPVPTVRPSVTVTSAPSARTPIASPSPEPTSTRTAYWQTQVAAVTRTTTMVWATNPGRPTDPGPPGRFTSLSFVSATNGFALGHIAVPIPDEPYAIALGRTTDGGATWESRALPDRGLACLNEMPEILFRDDRVGWLRCHGLLVTDDGGWTWQLLSSNDPVIDWGRSPSGQLWVWLTDGSGNSAIYEPRPGGLELWRALVAVWPNTGVGPSSTDWPDSVSVWDDRTIAFAELLPQGGSGFERIWWATADGGATWHELALPCIRRGWMSASVSLGPDRIAWAGCGGMPGGTLQDKRLTRSVDFGATWTVVGEAPIVRSGEYVDSTASHVPTDGHLWSIQALSANGVYGLLGRASGPLISRDAGQSWTTPVLWPCTVPDTSLVGSYVDAKHGWIADGGGLARTDDGGADWPDSVSVWDDRTIAFAELLPQGGSGFERIWWATADGGATWHELALPCVLSYWMSVSVSMGPDSIAWAGCGGMAGGTQQDKRLTRSADFGATWTVVGEAPLLRSGVHLDLTAAPVAVSGHLGAIQTLSETAAYALLGRASGPLITRDAGQSWNTPVLWPCVVTDTGLYGGFVDDKHGRIAGAAGLARTDDGGATWTCLKYPARP